MPIQYIVLFSVCIVFVVQISKPLETPKGSLYLRVYLCEIISNTWFSVHGYVHGSNYMGNHHSQADHGHRHENNSSGFMLHSAR